jgi:hypothetical protein
MRRITTVVVIGMLALPATAAAFTPLAGVHLARVAPLTFRLRAGHQTRGCTRGIPASLSIAPSVRLNGHALQTASTGGWVVYYAGDGTLVQLHSYPGNGPVCATAMTWLPRATVRVRFVVS